MIEQRLKERVSDLVGGRVYPLILPGPEPSLPALVYQRISTSKEHSHDGPGLQTARFTISVWAETYSEARAVAHRVSERLDGWRTPGIASLGAGEWDDKDELTGRTRVLCDYLVSYVNTEGDS